MKKTILLVITAGLLGGCVTAQNFNTTFSAFTFTNHSDDAYDYSTDLIKLSKDPLWLGVGTNIGPSWESQGQGSWHVSGAVKFQYMETFSNNQERTYGMPSQVDLLSQKTTKARMQYFGGMAALGAGRDFQAFHHKWQAFGSFYTRLTLRDWYKASSKFTSYETGREKTTHRLDWHSNNLYQNVLIGIQGGVRFPILTVEQGQLKGEVSLVQDLSPAYKNQARYSSHRFTSLSVGAVYVPTGRHATPNLPGQEIESPQGRRVPKDGFQFGLTQLDLVLTSANMAYLSKKKIGLEASVRFSWELGDINLTTTYIGAMYQLRNSRFFLKAGMETIYSKSAEYDDIGKYRVAYVGGKYLLPLSACIGLQLELGIYSGEHDLPVFPGLGVGFSMGRYGVK